MSAAEAEGAAAASGAGSESDDYGEKVERVLDGVTGYVRKVMHTFALLLFRPLRASLLLRRETRGRYTPPLGFLVTGYFAASLAGALASDLYAALGQSDQGVFGTVFNAAQKQVETIDVAPLNLILLSFPVLVTLLLVAFLAGGLLRLDHSVVIALCAYTTAFLWYYVATAVLAYLAVMGVAVVIDAGVALVAFFLLIPVVMLAVLGGAVVWLMQVITLAVAASSRRGLRKTLTVLVLVAAAAGTGFADTRLLATALGKKLSVPGVDVAVQLRDLEFSGRDAVGITFLDAADTSFDRAAESGGALQPALPLSVVVVLRNRSDTTLLVRRHSRGTAGNLLRAGFLAYVNGAIRPTCEWSMELAITGWSDGESPVLVLRKGEVKWIRFSGKFPGPAGQLDGSVMKVRVATEDGFFESPWRAVSIEGTLAPDSASKAGNQPGSAPDC
jgi:hypothetical protein